MTSILEYIRQLAPVHERRELLSTLTQLQDEHKATLSPLLNDLRQIFANFQFRSEVYLQFDQQLRRQVNTRLTALEVILESLEHLEKNYPFLEKQIKTLFSIQFSSANITYDRVNLMRYVEAAAFYVRYARKLLLAIVAEEAALVGKATPTHWTRAEREFLSGNMQNFAGLVPSIYVTESELRQTLSRVSNAEVDIETHDLAVRSLGNAKLDPMRLQHFSPQRNPLISIGKALAEWQVRRYKAAVEEHDALQLRLQELRELSQSGNASPKLQRLITQTEERVEKLNFHIAKIEEENRYE